MSTRMETVLVVHPGAELFGSDRMLLESVLGLREAGTRVVVALPSHGPLLEPLRASGAEAVIVPMLVLRKALLRPSGWLRLFRDTFRGLGSAWRLITHVQPDAVYVSTITVPLWPAIARMRGRRVVSHVHEAEASGNRLVNLALYLPHLAAHRVLVNSEFSLATIRSVLPRLARHAQVLYNGVDAPEQPTPPRGAIEGPFRITYVGRLSPRKGPDIVIDAASALGRAGIPTHVTLVGSAFEGYEWFEEELHVKVDAAHESTVVEFAGFHTDVWPFLADTDVLIVPSRLDEPFGNTAVEGILARRPVIASDTSGLREAAGGYRSARLAAPGDVDAFVRRLTELHASWEEVSSSTDADAALARERHDPAGYRAGVRAAVASPVR
ncbi:glycosyltransferase [Microbacterium koreense]|uniref:Glycosyltransferase n=1 Tax=Microbacterium koreense TaxID=323761 RepID=A0ABW2ZP21_9MICO